MQEKTGISRATWSNYENGSTEPDFDKLIRIATFFKIDLDTLILVDISDNEYITQKESNSIDGEIKLPNSKKVTEYNPNEQEKSEVNERGETALWYLLREVRAIREDLDEIKARGEK